MPIIADYVQEKTDDTSLVDALFGLTNKHGRPFNPSIDLNPILYCGLINNLPLGCMTQNILELWKFDDVRIGELTKEDILRSLNTTKISPTSGHDTDFVQLLGGVTRNSSGHIVSATSMLSHWMVYVNFTDVDHDIIGNSAGTEDWVIISLDNHF